MIYSKINNLFPNFTIGFPFEMYYQFEVRGECDERTLLHRTHFNNLIICFVLSAIFNKKQPKPYTPLVGIPPLGG